MGVSSNLCFLPKAGPAQEKNGHRLEMERQPSASCSFTSEAPHRADCSVEPSGGGSLNHSTCVGVFPLCEGRGWVGGPHSDENPLGAEHMSDRRGSVTAGRFPPSKLQHQRAVCAATLCKRGSSAYIHGLPRVALRTLRGDAGGPPAPDPCGSG